MRRSLTLASAGSFLFALALLIATWGSTSGASSTLFHLATPPVDQAETGVYEGINVMLMGSVEPTEADASPLWMLQVELDPGAPMFASHTHEGASVLTVASGAICYQQGAGTTTAVATEDGATTDACGPGTTSCDEDGCTLTDGDLVYLSAGSTLIQAATADHSYGNADDSAPAVVYLAENPPPPPPGTPPPGCASGCPKP